MTSGKSDRNVLVFVQIPTHFIEMIRVAELLRASPGYRPTVLFMALYAGVEKDMARCRAAEIDFMSERDFPRYLAKPRAVRKPARLGPWIRARLVALRRAAHPDPVDGWLSNFKRRLGKAAMRPGFRYFHRIDFRSVQSIVFSRRRGLRYVQRATSALLGRALSLIKAMARPLITGVSRQMLRQVPSDGTRERIAALPQWLRRLGTHVGNGLSLLLLPLRPVARAAAVLTFGLFYRFGASHLPPDIRSHHYLWRVIPGLMEDKDFGIVVLPEDNFFYFTNLFVKAIHARDGIAVIVPFTVVNTLEWAEAFYPAQSHDGRVVINRLMGLLFPTWVHEHRNRILVMPFQHILCNALFRTDPPVPWLINSGHADAIAVESSFMLDYYLKAGLPARQLYLTGALYDDALYQARKDAPGRREAAYEKLSLPPGRPMILCALPPDQLKGLGRPQCEFTDYSELLRSFLEPLQAVSATYNVVLSLHPRITAQEMARLDTTGLTVSRDDIADLIPLSQIYVASCSATIRLAVTCGVPVVNFDVYGYDYDEYKIVPGIVTVDRSGEYVSKIRELCAAGEEFERLSYAQQEFALRESPLDGLVGTRLVGLLENLVARRGNARPD